MEVVSEPHAPQVDSLEIDAYRIDLDEPESDGTLEWDARTTVVAQIQADGKTGLGYTYGNAAIARLADTKLRPIVTGRNALAVRAAWNEMYRSVRNVGQPGIAAAAISAVDSALWDLKARLLNLPLAVLLDAVREEVPVYGSGGFTSYSTQRLQEQLDRWVADGISMVKMKVGRPLDENLARVAAARDAIGDAPDLMIDANGAFSRKEALHFAERCMDYDVVWFEEPVSSDDLRGLRLLRDRVPAPIEITAGEYGYNRFYFRRMLEAEAVDVLQIDATRCGGITGFLEAAHLAAAHNIDVSAHIAPNLHSHPCCAVTNMRHIEYFYDDTQTEPMLFEGTLEPVNGALRPDFTAPGNGLHLERAKAESYSVYSSRETVSR